MLTGAVSNVAIVWHGDRDSSNYGKQSLIISGKGVTCSIDSELAAKSGTDLISLARLLRETDAKIICVGRDAKSNNSYLYDPIAFQIRF